MRKVSFKISKNGTRYCAKAKPNPSAFVDNEVDDTTSSSVSKPHHHQLVPARVQCDIDLSKKRSVVDLTEDDDDEDTDDIPDADVSFIVNIFPHGYTIDKSLKSIAAHQIALMYNPKLLRPYDRASQSLFRAIKCCRVPANFFEDIPCTYENGKVACELRDWRKDSAEPAGVSINGPSVLANPSIRRISLKMSVNSIVRDIPQMSKRDFWAYSELLEAESKILLALYPKLDLDPCPNFDRLCKKPTTVKLNLDFRAMRRKRLRPMSVAKKSNLRTEPNVANPPSPRNHAPGASSTHALVNLSSGNDGINSLMSAFEGGRGNLDSLPSSSMANSDHRNQSNPLSFVGNQQQKIASNNALGASSSAAGASSTHAMQNASSNQDRQSSYMANSNNRIWRDPLSLIGNHQQMTLEILENTPGTAFSALRASSTRSMSLASANDGRWSFESAFDGRTVNQDGQSLSPMAYLDGRMSQSNSLVFLGNQQQQQASHMQYNPARTSANAPGASSSHGMTNLNSNHGGASSIIPFDGNNRNQDGHSSSLVKMENSWSNPSADVVNQHQLVPLHNQNTSRTTSFSALRASSTHDIMSLNSNNDGISSIIPFDDGKMGNQDGSLSSVASLDNRNQPNPLVYDGYQQPKLETHMTDHAQRTAFGVPGAYSTHSMFGLDDKSGNQDGQSSFMANADNRNQSNSLAIVGNQQQQIASYMDSTSSQTDANVPGGSSTQGTVSLSSDDDIDIRAILSAIEGNDCSPMANNANNNQSNPLVSVGYQQHGMVSSGSDDGDLWSFMSAFDNKRGHQDGQSSSMSKRNRLNPSPYNGFQLQQMAGSSSHVDNSNAPDSRWKNTQQSTGKTQMVATLGSKPLPTIPILSGIRSSSAIGNTSGLSSANATVQRELDRSTQDRFTKIGLLTARYNLNCKEVKVDDYQPTINIPSSQLNHDLINSNDSETLIDETCKMPLSKSHAGGNVNLCKIRIMKFVKEAYSHRAGDEEITVAKSETKLILSERQRGGTVTMHYCKFDDHDHSTEEELLPTFPNTHMADMFAAEFCSLMEREGYTKEGDYLQTKPVSVVQLSDIQCKCAFGPAFITGKPYPVGTRNASRSSSTPNMWINAEVGGFSVASPGSPISDALDSLIQTSDAMVLTSHSVSIGQNLNMQQQVDVNQVSHKPTPILQQQQSQRRQGNMTPPGNIVGTWRNIGDGNSMVGGQGSGNMRRGAPHAGRRPGAATLAIFDPNTMEIKPRIAQRRPSVSGRSRGQSSNAGGSQGGNLQVPLGSGSRSRGRGSRGRGSRGQSSRGQGSNITPDNNVNPM